MIKPTTKTEELIYSTTRITTKLADGEAVGTGFFFRYHSPTNGMTGDFIVTNTHVIEGGIKGTLTAHYVQESEHGEKRGFDEVELEQFEDLWWKHPDQDIDLCVMPAERLYENVRKDQKNPVVCVINWEAVPLGDALTNLSAVEDVLMVGYPNALWDAVNNYPIVRRGITASHPAINHNGKHETVVDIACFPGSSGSPVVICNEGNYTTKDGAAAGGGRLLLLGVLYAGPVINAEGQITTATIPTSPTEKLSTVQTGIMMHLGYIIKASQVIDIIEHHSPDIFTH